MDVLTEHVCPDCQGTGAWLNPDDCSTCAGKGAIAHAEYGLRLLGEINAQLAGIRARQDLIVKLQGEITARMAILGLRQAMLTGEMPEARTKPAREGH